jgi:DNA-binding transcriptional regulator GbsR (MarR family)
MLYEGYRHFQSIQFIKELQKKINIVFCSWLKGYRKYLFSKQTEFFSNLSKGMFELFQLLINMNGSIHSKLRKLHLAINSIQIKGGFIEEHIKKLKCYSHGNIEAISASLISGY